VGTLGDVGCFSLQGSKSVVAGEGGVMVTDSERCYQRAMIPGHHDERLSQELRLADLEPFAHAGGYWKYRIAPLAAAIATAQLKTLDGRNAARQANFDRLHARLSEQVPFISWPQLPRGSTRGWYGAPATYDYDPERVPRDLFMEACTAEGVPLDSGYQNWYQTPLFQDEGLYSQLWPAIHANGVAYKPLPSGALPNDEAMRKVLLRFQIPAIETPPYMDQIATAVEKVAANMDVLALGRGTGGLRRGFV
jgi:dTDP-4-amino-4,6-dideoxygalactose transaminase